ncbi:phosphotransferase family protein [Aeromicrobium sp. UC242_57]|uniref:phosphotransferase family protein n=1 Tax=Aeromicrobium sp. UC242_57 TaxID=3374624 RepID=UPI0037B5F53F
MTRPERLGPALASATGDDRWTSFEAHLIAGGKSNLTFEITSEAGSLVLRRPPSGNLLPSAHDMFREARVQRALTSTDVPVAPVLLLDPDGDLLGVPSYVMSKVEGHVIREALPADFATTADERVGLGHTMVDTLVTLHAIDPAAVGLQDFGRPEGFVARQIRRWGGQWDKSKTHDVPELTRLGALLTERLPSTQRTSIVHGDYKIDNCILDVDDPTRIAALLDWEMSTLGDPMTDLGMMLFYWREADQDQHALIPTVTDQPGFPTRQHLAERYAAATGVTLDEIDYYRAFANFKFAIIVQGVSARAAAGSMAGQDFGNLDPLVLECARAGLDLLKG